MIRTWMVLLFVVFSFRAFGQSKSADFEQFIGYWTAEPGWVTELQLKNNQVSGTMIVTPTLRTWEGEESSLPAVNLQPQEAKSIDVSAAAAQLAVSYGSIVLRYRSQAERSIFAAAMIYEPGHPIAFHIDATGEDQSRAAGSREGIWWLPNETASDYLILTNQGNFTVKADLSLSNANGKEVHRPLMLTARQTARYSVRQLVRAAGFSGSYGGIRISAESHAGSLDSIHFLFDELSGFSALLKMFDRNPQASIEERDFAKTRIWTMRAPMLALSEPDPALGFPAGTRLQPQIIVRNSASKPVTASLRFNWRTLTSTGQTTGPTLQLAPLETQRIEVAALQESGKIPKDATWTSVILTTTGPPDELVAVAVSYDASLRYGAETPFSDQLAFKWEGGAWEYDTVHDSMITVGNGGTVPTKVVTTLFYGGGKERYEVEQTLQAEEQMWIDVGRLVRERIPDRTGRILPIALTTGTYEIREVSRSGIGTLFEGKVIYDKTYGNVAYGCANCCGWRGVGLANNPLDIGFGGGAQNGVNGSDTCGGYPEDISYLFSGSWSTVNQSIATVNGSGYHHGVNAGLTSTTATAIIPSYAPRSCPATRQTPTGGDHVASAILSQRTSGSVSSDDAALQAYNTGEGSISLGAIIGTGSPVQGCFIGNEVIGTITPNTYTGNVILHRWILADAYYNNQSPISGGVTNQDDTSQPGLRDDDPQSGGSAGKVYDLDAPGINIHNADGITYRYRGNFYAWAALPDGTRISPYYNYFVRVSCVRTTSGYHFDNTLPGDNQIQAGTTLTTWNFK
jgi:hypothetical protein